MKKERTYKAEPAYDEDVYQINNVWCIYKDDGHGNRTYKKTIRVFGREDIQDYINNLNDEEKALNIRIENRDKDIKKNTIY